VARDLRPTRPRRHCAQHNETDLAFVSRLLAEEGLSWRFEESPGRSYAPAGHTLVLFADSTHAAACPEDPSSQQPLGGVKGHGIRFQDGRGTETQDGVYALAQQGNPFSAQRILRSADDQVECPSQTHMARAEFWQGRSNVRTFTGGAGTHFKLCNSPHRVLCQGRDVDPILVLLSVTSIGFNNFPRAARQALDAQLGPLSAQLQQSLQALQVSQDTPAAQGAHDASGTGMQRANIIGLACDAEPVDLLPLDDAFAQARASGYANRFEAVPTIGKHATRWRPVLQDGTGLSVNPSPV
jgi:uncharacterized protein involved in type VI secretion and phage assembly